MAFVLRMRTETMAKYNGSHTNYKICSVRQYVPEVSQNLLNISKQLTNLNKVEFPTTVPNESFNGGV